MARPGVYKAHAKGTGIDAAIIDSSGAAYGVITSGVLNVLSAWETSRRLDSELYIENDVFVSNTVSIDLPTLSRRKVGGIKKRPDLKVELDHILSLGKGRGTAVIDALVKKRQETRAARNSINEKIDRSSRELNKSIEANVRDERITRVLRDTSLTMCMTFGAGQLGLLFEGMGAKQALVLGSRTLSLVAQRRTATGFLAAGWLCRAAARATDVYLTENTSMSQVLGAELIDLEIGAIQSMFAFIAAPAIATRPNAEEVGFVVISFNFIPNITGSFLSAVSDELVSGNPVDAGTAARVFFKTNLGVLSGLVVDKICTVGVPMVASLAKTPAARDGIQGAGEFCINAINNNIKEVVTNAVMKFGNIFAPIRSAPIDLNDPSNDRAFVEKNCIVGPIKIVWAKR